jgi:hypothetical protein
MTYPSTQQHYTLRLSKMNQEQLLHELTCMNKQSLELQGTCDDVLVELALNRELLKENTSKIRELLLLIDNGDAETTVQQTN